MTISPNIQTYIENSKINGILCKWDKSIINVFITQITHNIPNKNFLYSEILRGMTVWNENLRKNGINIQFQQTQSPDNADIIIHWTKVGRVYNGMCKYPSVVNGIIKKIYIDVGLKNDCLDKNTTEESIFFVIMHELGHSLGLGHGVEIDDLMYSPRQKRISTPNENDIYVLKQIYGVRG